MLFAFRMVGGIRGEGRDPVSWAARMSDSSSSLRRLSSQSLSGFSSAANSPTTANKPGHTFFSPSEHHFVDESPLPMSTASAEAPPVQRDVNSAPAELHHHHRQLSALVSPGQQAKVSLDNKRAQPVESPSKDDESDFELDENAPSRVAQERSKSADNTTGSAGTMQDEDGVKRWDAVGMDTSLPVVEEVDERGEGHTPEGAASSKTHSPSGGNRSDDPVVNERLEAYSLQQQQNVLQGQERASRASNARVADGDGADGAGEQPVWGDSFKIEWIRTNHLPFYRTRHLRNRWNHDREVKVSRDGTELEPSVGQALLDEWEKMDADGAAGTTRADEKRPATAETSAPDDAAVENVSE
ncbi:hypothetical protein EUX98_g4153 [Antrodiella citrinella]|uniref:YTH domain-containing protein n=1 Tax=Antrodiella citrinella TaxID=2447956 RepID=A0A4V3XIP9_9APHY|nr:hypothetical protein EUX98_g4153 [Antrodiella citrinella]